jgi:RluA family pseudouridine synthase
MQITKLSQIPVLFEDEHVLVLDKPAGLLSVPDRWDHEVANILTLLREKYSDIFTVHRLDRETSGVILFAKDAQSHRSLSIAFEERRVSKQYIALVTGTPKDESGMIDLAIEENPAKQGTMKLAKKGKECLTEYKVAEKFRDYSLVEVTLHTGRTHQIRVHFQGIGHPLAVDAVYGGQKELCLSKLKRGYHFPEWENERPLLSRVPLHSWKLAFPHPVTGEIVTVEAPLPKDIKAVLFQLRKLKK